MLQRSLCKLYLRENWLNYFPIQFQRKTISSLHNFANDNTHYKKKVFTLFVFVFHCVIKIGTKLCFVKKCDTPLYGQNVSLRSLLWDQLMQRQRISRLIFVPFIHFLFYISPFLYEYFIRMKYRQIKIFTFNVDNFIFVLAPKGFILLTSCNREIEKNSRINLLWISKKWYKFLNRDEILQPNR